MKNILKEHGFDPGPKRGKGTWDEFLKIHAETLWQCDFMSKKTWTLGGLVDMYLLVFIQIGSRRVWISSATAHPDSAWVAQQARNVCMEFAEEKQMPTDLIHDADTKFTTQFDEIFKAEGIRVKRLLPRCPNMNARVHLLMDTSHLKSKFEKLGARAKVRPLVLTRSQRQTSGPVVIDIGQDRHGEFFDIQTEPDADVLVLDVQPKDRHLLLMVRQPANRHGLPDIKDKFLCGHDERHWFVAGVPEKAPVSTVLTAKEALKPELVRNLESGKRGKQKKRHRRKTNVFIRQGEWFFLPAPGIVPDEKLVLPNEPLRRGRGKAHMCGFLYRVGGTTVYVCRQYPNGLTEKEYKALLKQNTAAAKWNWRVMQRDPTVFVQGNVSHPDHATIHLGAWHRVAMNTENQSRAMASVAFLD